MLAIWARGPRLRAEPVGKVALGAQASSQPLQHWADMLAHAGRPIAQWHRLWPAGEVEQALGLQSPPAPRACPCLAPDSTLCRELPALSCNNVSPTTTVCPACALRDACQGPGGECPLSRLIQALRLLPDPWGR